MPSARGVLRSCLVTLLGYAITVAASLAVMVLVIAALAVSDDSSDSDPSSEIDIEAIGTIVGMPFQLAALALGGRLRLSSGDFSVALYAPPLLITAVFGAACFLLSRRSERRTPSASLLERALLAASGAFATAVLATFLTRLLAMRDDGDVMHAAGVGLFFGVLIIGGVAGLLGQLSVSGSLWPRWLPPDGRRAVHLVTQHLLLWSVVVIPIATIWLLLDDGAEVALYSVIWGPTVALGAFAMGHLGAVTVVGEDAFAWDLGWFPGIALPVIAVSLALVVSLAWHLRRRQEHGWLAQPASWIALPVAYALAALVVCLLSTVGLSGDFYGVGGGVTFHSAYWLIPVLAVWGAAIEALSRFVAPALVRAVPQSLSRRLATGPAHLLSPPLEATHRIPMSPRDRIRAKRALIGLGIVGGLGLIGLIAFSIVGSSISDPEKRAEDYLDALVDGNVEEALSLAPVDGDEAGEALLTNAVYAEAEDRITGYEITDVEEYGDTVTVTVDLQGVEDGDDVQLSLEEDGQRALFFSDWKVAEGGLASEVTVTVPEQSESLTVNGVEIPAGAGQELEFWALPGSYAFDPYGDSKWLESAESVTTVPGSSYGMYAELETPQPSEELTELVQTQMEEWVNGCMAATEVDPADCPQSVYGSGERQRNVTWKLDTMPTLVWDYFTGTFPATMTSEDSGEATASYEYDASYGIGAPDWTAESDESSFSVTAEVELVDDEPLVTFESY